MAITALCGGNREILMNLLTSTIFPGCFLRIKIIGQFKQAVRVMENHMKKINTALLQCHFLACHLRLSIIIWGYSTQLAQNYFMIIPYQLETWNGTNNLIVKSYPAIVLVHQPLHRCEPFSMFCEMLTHEHALPAGWSSVVHQLGNQALRHWQKLILCWQAQGRCKKSFWRWEHCGMG